MNDFNYIMFLWFIPTIFNISWLGYCARRITKLELYMIENLDNTSDLKNERLKMASAFQLKKKWEENND